MLQTAEDLQAAAHFKNTVEFVIDKFGPLSNDKITGEICVLTSWCGFDEAENTVEPIYEKWIDVPQMLKNHFQELADKGSELAIEGLDKIKIWESAPSDDLAGTTGDTYPGSYSRHSPLTSLLSLCYAMRRCCAKHAYVYRT
jgi:hypothetical protein